MLLLVVQALERWDIVIVLATISGLVASVTAIYKAVRTTQDKQTESIIATQAQFSEALTSLKDTVVELRVFVDMSNKNLGAYIERNEQEHKKFMEQMQAQTEKISEIDKALSVCQAERKKNE